MSGPSSCVPVTEWQQQNDWARCASPGHVTALCGSTTFPPQPQRHYVLLEGAVDEKRESALPPGPGAPQTHSKACWEPVAMTAASNRERGEERKEATKWKQVEQANSNFSAGKTDLNHMFPSHTEASLCILGHCRKIRHAITCH